MFHFGLRLFHRLRSPLCDDLLPVLIQRVEDEFQAWISGVVEDVLDCALKVLNAIIVFQGEHFQFLEVEGVLIRVWILAYPVDVHTCKLLVYGHREEQRLVEIEIIQARTTRH